MNENPYLAGKPAPKVDREYLLEIASGAKFREDLPWKFWAMWGLLKDTNPKDADLKRKIKDLAIAAEMKDLAKYVNH